MSVRHLAIDLGGGHCVKETDNGPPCQMKLVASGQLVSGSEPAVGDLGPHLPSCWPPTSPLASLGSRHAGNTHLAHPSNLWKPGEKTKSIYGRGITRILTLSIPCSHVGQKQL